MARGNWTVTPATAELVFSRDPDELWPRLERRGVGQWAQRRSDGDTRVTPCRQRDPPSGDRAGPDAVLVPKWFHMASLTLKNVPEPMLTRLRARAQEERRSLNQEALYLLEEALRTEGTSAELRAQAQVASWRALAGRWRSKRPVHEEIREIYAARTRGRTVHL